MQKKKRTEVNVEHIIFKNLCRVKIELVTVIGERFQLTNG